MENKDEEISINGTSTFPYSINPNDDYINNKNDFSIEFVDKWDRIESNLQKSKLKHKLHSSSNSHLLDIPSHHNPNPYFINEDYQFPGIDFIHPLDSSFEEFSNRKYNQLEEMKVAHLILDDIDESDYMNHYQNPKSILDLPDYEDLSLTKQSKQKDKDREQDTHRMKPIKTFLKQEGSDKNQGAPYTKTNGKNKNFTLTFGEKVNLLLGEIADRKDNNEGNGYSNNGYDHDQRQIGQLYNGTKAYRKYNDDYNTNTNYNDRGKKKERNINRERIKIDEDDTGIIDKKKNINYIDYFDQALKEAYKTPLKIKHNNKEPRVIQKINDNKKYLNFLFKTNKK